MSGLAGLYNIPGSPEELDVWAFIHAAHHRDINRIIFELYQITLPEYGLDPIDPQNVNAWNYQHQEMHSIQDEILGISGFNLSDVDWTDRGQLASFIFLNASEHYQAAQILGIG